MKTEAFQNLLLKSAVSVIACDGSIDEAEISEIRNMAENEIYFIGYDFEEPLEANLQTIMGLMLVCSERTIKNRRIDTLAYDEQINAFVIIEYKRIAIV